MFFHILLWNLYPDANPADVAEGMRRMQRENPDDLKRLTFGRRAEVVSGDVLRVGTPGIELRLIRVAEDDGTTKG